MPNLIREARFIKASVENNNNKFWYISEFDDASCLVHFGRVGNDGATLRHSFDSQGQADVFFDRKCREKQGDRKGYRPLDVFHDGSPALAKEHLARLANEQIQADCPQTRKLIRYLTEVNVHNVLSATTLSYNVAEGLFSTPCGIVTAQSIARARGLLTCIGKFVSTRRFRDPAYLALLNDYLMLVPQKIRGRLDAERLFPDRDSLRRQNDILDALEASLQTVLAAKGNDNQTVQQPRIFDVKLDLISSRKEVNRIRRLYQATLHAAHACAHLDIRTVYAVDIASMRTAWETQGQRLGNVQQLWHGTRASNLLSILKHGLVIPPSNAPYCTGRMFGNGLYFSDQSTKSLNYAYGYWQGQAEDHCFMFLVDVAMGKSYVPRSHAEPLPKPGYDSTFAQAEVSSVRNNEMIVYQTNQVNLRYLVEFAAD